MVIGLKLAACAVASWAKMWAIPAAKFAPAEVPPKMKPLLRSTFRLVEDEAQFTISKQSANPTGNGCLGARRYSMFNTRTSASAAIARQETSSVSKSPITKPPR
ncbi:hypothetical protein BJX99DRAFT_218743 [Aspergillus californicus]